MPSLYPSLHSSDARARSPKNSHVAKTKGPGSEENCVEGSFLCFPYDNRSPFLFGILNLGLLCDPFLLLNQTGVQQATQVRIHRTNHSKGFETNAGPANVKMVVRSDQHMPSNNRKTSIRLISPPETGPLVRNEIDLAHPKHSKLRSLRMTQRQKMT